MFTSLATLPEAWSKVWFVVIMFYFKGPMIESFKLAENTTSDWKSHCIHPYHFHIFTLWKVFVERRSQLKKYTGFDSQICAAEVWHEGTQIFTKSVKRNSCNNFILTKYLVRQKRIQVLWNIVFDWLWIMSKFTEHLHWPHYTSLIVLFLWKDAH